MFWAWVHRKLDVELEVSPQLHDIQRLNQLALESASLPLTKVSMATFLEPRIMNEYRLLSSGAALGRGCGPLVVSQGGSHSGPIRLAIPGRNTTACKLAEMALGEQVKEWVELRYDEIMPAVLAGKVDAGVIIHESRFVYHDLGLECAFDLGAWWEEETGFPLPLGVMVARKELSDTVVAQVEVTLRNSISLAQSVMSGGDDEAKASLWRYLRENAIEMEDSTMSSHIELYVNQFSLDLGDEGRAAIAEFEKRVLGGIQV